MTTTNTQTDEDHAALLQKALAAGQKARDQVTEGVTECWAFHVVQVIRHTSPFGRYLKKHGLGSPPRTRGDQAVTIYSGGSEPYYETGQAWSHAVSAVLCEAGIMAFAGSYDD